MSSAPTALFLVTVVCAHRPWDSQSPYKQSHIMDSHNKLTLGSGRCSTQLMPVLIRAWKYYLGLAARSKKSILSQVINSALSDCSPIPGSSMSLYWLLPLNFLYDLHFHASSLTKRNNHMLRAHMGLWWGLAPTWQIVQTGEHMFQERENFQDHGSPGSANPLNVLASITVPLCCYGGPTHHGLKSVEFSRITCTARLQRWSNGRTNN